MSYTMTLDVPDRTAAYVERRGPRYRAELNAIFVAIVAANMQNDETEAQREGFEWGESVANVPLKTGSSFARAWGRIGVEEGELNLSRCPEHLREIDFA